MLNHVNGTLTINVATAPTITSATTTSIVHGTGGTFTVVATGTTPITFTLNNAPTGVTIITSELVALGMDVPPIIYQNRTMVPLRFISEFFGAIVNWDSETQGIEIIWDSAPPSDNN